MNFPERLFVTGTDTDVGKTVVSAILMAGLQDRLLETDSKRIGEDDRYGLGPKR